MEQPESAVPQLRRRWVQVDRRKEAMRSSKDIPPRVGMQVRFCLNGRTVETNKVSRVFEATGFYGSDGEPKTGGIAWKAGHYEIDWQPPSDDERRLFMEAARHCRSTAAGDLCGEFCDWRDNTWILAIEGARIAESLALDGADYDDMPQLEGLER
jgi:hypothetical protein